jgi:hypothetical protein
MRNFQGTTACSRPELLFLFRWANRRTPRNRSAPELGVIIGDNGAGEERGDREKGGNNETSHVIFPFVPGVPADLIL